MSSHQPSAFQALKVLIIEDEGLIALDIRKALSALGHEVTGIASTAEDALNLVAVNPPDLVLMDIQLQGSVDGIATAKQIAQGRDIPVIFLTAHSDRETVNRVKQADPYGYIVKPFTPASLNVTVEMAIQRKAAGKLLVENNQDLCTLNDRLTRLSYSLNNDLREPLRSVSAASQLLARMGEGFDPDTREYIDWIAEGCSQINSLLSSLLEYYQNGAGGSQAGLKASADECLDTALQHLRATLQQADAEVQFHPLPEVACHRVALVQIFQNLIAAALKYRGDRQPEIFISTHRDAGTWIFAIADNGAGFSPDEAESLFEFPDPQSQSKEGGTIDVGLALCKRLLETYNGTIWVDSSVGYGSTFFFTLPAISASEATRGAGVTVECRSF